MKRKQIYIEETQERELKELAADRDVPEAVIVRSALDEYLKANRPRITPPKLRSMKDHPLWKIVGIGKNPDAPTDGAVNHDYYLYGAPKKRP